jgi:hypothetical protein
MGILKNIIAKLRARKDDKSAYARERYIEEDYEERKKDSDERELERFYEEDRKRLIKRLLAERKRKQKEDMWSGRIGNPINAQNIMTGNRNLFTADNMFADADNLFTNKDNMFFRRG